jgi:hypothetical protein
METARATEGFVMGSDMHLRNFFVARFFDFGEPKKNIGLANGQVARSDWQVRH